MPVFEQPSGQRFNSIPVLHTRGTHYEVGFDVGRTFRAMIEDYLATSKDFNKSLLPSYNTPKGRDAYNAALQVLRENFPQYVREIEGTADGARAPFEHLMLLNLDQVVFKNSGLQATSSSSACSSISCNNKGQALLGHTEDSLPETLNRVYLLDAEIEEETPQGRWKTQKEKFTAFCYAGQLPGYCMSFNKHGLVSSINAIFPQTVLTSKTPCRFLTRAMLAARTPEEAHQILMDKGVGLADGMSINLCYIREEGDILFENIEVGQAEKECDNISIKLIGPGEKFFHANKFLRLSVPEDEFVAHPSSNSRHATFASWESLETAEDVIALLSDTSDPAFPIYRVNTEEDPVDTVAVGLFNLSELTWTLWMKKPNSCRPIVALPLSFPK